MLNLKNLTKFINTLNKNIQAITFIFYKILLQTFIKYYYYLLQYFSIKFYFLNKHNFISVFLYSNCNIRILNCQYFLIDRVKKIYTKNIISIFNFNVIIFNGFYILDYVTIIA